LLALFGSPVAVSSAIMATQMKNDEELAGQLVVWTTITSSFTIFAIITILKSIGIF
jgi:predicted permease